MQTASLSLVLAGPILRRTQSNEVNLWLATSAVCRVKATLYPHDASPEVLTLNPGEPGLTVIHAGERLHYLLITLRPAQPLPKDSWIRYELALQPADQADGPWLNHQEWAPDLCYEGETTPKFRITLQTHTVLHGSCRKPHFPGPDGLVAADTLLQRVLSNNSDTDLPEWPSVLVMTGDQIYADDVAGPMLSAIHSLVAQLGLPSEQLSALEVGDIDDSTALYAKPTLYQRSRLLPKTETRQGVLDTMFNGVRKPVFTAVNADNHLITLAEVLAMYLLVWSPAPWASIQTEPPQDLNNKQQQQFEAEHQVLEEFTAGLSRVRRLLAHIPTAMIFDDHDITDDWNLNREWEEAAYEHPFSLRVIGNALIGYLINQAWGNQPDLINDEAVEELQAVLDHPGTSEHDSYIEQLLGFEAWDFRWESDPPLIVLDTRTRRWRSESSARKPSGLLDWEALTDLQRGMRGLDRVLLISAAPIFGVKLIESVQALFAFFGKPLLVDSEYWLGHRGTASGILNVFRHRKTPQNFVVLSGDVHYSFVYDVELRGMRGGPDIWQICSSGLKNEFPDGLLRSFDHLNRWLYSPRSPLNWFTRRRKMRVIPRKPEGTAHGRRVLNGSGIGLVELDDTGAPWRIRQLLAGDDQLVQFDRREEEARWD